jgi:hypothetical protein
MLGELAELGLMVAKELAVRLRESEDTAETVELAGAFHKVSRVVRLTLALDFKLERDAAREAREQAREIDRRCDEIEAGLPKPGVPTPVGQEAPHQVRVRKLANKLIWNETEGDGPEYDLLFMELDARMENAVMAPENKDVPFETLAQRIAADLGLSGHPALAAFEGAPRAASKQAAPKKAGLKKAGLEPRPDG